MAGRATIGAQAGREDVLEVDPAAADLRPLVPRGSLQWLRDHPEDRYRRIDGSLVFVDISGFTAMSERLARLGAVGAEEVTDLLNHTFGRLLAVAYEDDGSLLKFGGDALLLQFDGDEHCARAVHAAWGMRRKLRELQPLRSSAGQVRLRMSVGVHTGPIDQFLVGSSHRELLVVGPAATEVVRMESAATAGQIMVSGAVAEALGSRIRTVPAVEGGHLLRAAPDAPRQPPSTPKAPEPALARALLSSQLRERLEAGVGEAEHRASVIGFVKFRGIDALLERPGPEAAAAVLEGCVDAVTEACRPDDVCFLATDVDAGGVKFILTAGVPTSSEFDGERMLRALRAVVDADVGLPVHVGAHYGPVFAGVVGPWFRHTFTIIGDAVNLAARVMARAEAGEILATPEVLNRSQALFAIEKLPPFAVKGKKQPVTAWRVGAVTSERLRRARARFRLAGRDREVGALLAAADAAAAGPGALVQLVGPAGIGKSRLIDELHERRPDNAVVLAACSSHESTTPYFVLAQLARDLLQLADDADARALTRRIERVAPRLRDALPLLGDVLGIPVADNEITSDLTPAFRAERAALAIGELIGTLIPEPATIVIEDLHWIDPESRAALATIARTVLPHRRWLFIATSRHSLGLPVDDAVTSVVVPLEPLDDRAAREMVYAAVEEGLLSLERSQELLERGGGNPFFLQELLLVGADADLPDSVDALMQSQLDQQPPADRELLGYAALIGVDIDLDLLAQTTGIDVAAQRATFQRLGAFLDPTPEGGFRFRHALVQDAAYRRLPFRRRRELHRAAAAALEASPASRPDLLAWHTYHARDWERARLYALAAATQAAERFANLTAAAHLRHAIESGRNVRGIPDDEIAGDWERLGDLLLLASSYEEAVGAYQRARRLAPPRRQVHLCGQIGQVRERQGQYQVALRWYTRGVNLDEAVASGDRARLLLEMAITRNRQGRPREARQLAERAAPLCSGVQDLARLHYVRAWAAMLLGEDAPADRARTLELFEEAGDIVGQGLAYNIISMAAYYRGDWDEAAAAYERIAVLRRRVGDEVAAAAAEGNLGELRSDQGRFDEARRFLETCRAVCGAAGFASSRNFATMTLGRLDARAGRFDDAAAHLAEALEACESAGMGWMVFDCQRSLAELALYRGDVDAAVGLADRIDASAGLGTASLRVVGHRLRAVALLLAGDTARAAEVAPALVDELDPDAHDFDTALSLVAAAAVLREAGDARAAELRARAAAILDELGVVVPGELFVFGPASARVDAGRLSA